MIESLKPYLHAHQIPFLVVMVAWWLLGSSWLLMRCVRKEPGFRNLTLASCALAMFLSMLAAVVVGFLIFRLTMQVAESPESGNWVLVFAAVPGLILGVSIAFLVMYAIFQLRPTRLLRVTWQAFVSLALVCLIVGAPVAYFARVHRIEEGKAGSSVANLRQISDAIRSFGGQKGHEFPFPRSLDELTQEVTSGGKKTVLLPANALRSPFLPDQAVGYFYYPGTIDSNLTMSKALRACEMTHAKSDLYRAMLFANGNIWWGPDQDFQTFLALPENADFAKAFRAEEANRPK